MSGVGLTVGTLVGAFYSRPFARQSAWSFTRTFASDGLGTADGTTVREAVVFAVGEFVGEAVGVFVGASVKISNCSTIIDLDRRWISSNNLLKSGRQSAFNDLNE